VYELGQSSLTLETLVKRYDDYPHVAVFEQHFPQGVPHCAVIPTLAQRDGLVSGFPSFQTNSPGTPPLGFMQFNGPFINGGSSGPRLGLWSGKPAVSGVTAGPYALFKEGSDAVAVVGPMNSFMAASMAYTPDGNAYQHGVMGSVTEIPAQYTLQTLVLVGDTGINNAFTEWGRLLLQMSGKSPETPKFDFTISHLGYNTDNGAYYYYQTEANKTYLDTLLDVYDYSRQLGIPYRHALLDSWWYYKGWSDGVKNWTAMESIFPGGNEGIRNLFDQTGWPFIAHNRWWSNDTTYAKQSGGKWDFYVETQSTKYTNEAMALPLDQDFWNYLFSTSRQWGLYTYEQDWLYNEFLGLNLTMEHVDVAETWLTQMGNAAENNGIFIQYCMSYPRHALQSVLIRPVTQIRASDDNVPQNGKNKQWRIGGSSIFAHALGLAPFKDNWWSTPDQPGNKWDSDEPYVTVHGAVATYSTGPVTVADEVGHSDKDLIMRSCDENGRILKPARPATAIDATYYKVFNDSSGPSGEVWTTYSTTSSGRKPDIDCLLLWYHVLVPELKTEYNLSLTEILSLDGRGAKCASKVAYSVYSVPTVDFNLTKLQVMDLAEEHVSLSVTDMTSMDIYHLAPRLPNGWTVLGEMGKWVPVSEQRMVSVTWTTESVTVVLSGAPGERLQLSFVAPDARILHGRCTVGADGRVAMVIPGMLCL